MLEPSQGQNTFEDARFQRENLDKYNQLGNLAHANKKNPRAAISIFPPKDKVPGDVIMHTLTTGNALRGPGQVPRGASMKEWQDITTQGSYQYKPDKEKGGKNIKQANRRPSTLNLDGGGSVYMGITRGNGQTNQIASEKQIPTEVANILFAGGCQEKQGTKISIEDPNKKSKISSFKKFLKP